MLLQMHAAAATSVMWACAVQVLVTQPPFDMEQFSLWVEDARRRGVLQRAKLLVGHPMIRCVGVCLCVCWVGLCVL